MTIMNSLARARLRTSLGSTRKLWQTFALAVAQDAETGVRHHF